MANEKFTQLPTVVSAALTDVIAAVQTSTSVQETLQQVFNLFLSNTILHNAGNPNLAVAGSIYQLCWDTTNSVLYVCTTTGNATTAVWTLAGSVTFPVPVIKGGTGLSATTINQILYSSAANTIAGLATANSAILATTSAGVPVLVGSLTNGQLLIGSTSATPVAASLTAGVGISISLGAGSITISGTGGGIGWSEVTSATQTMTADSGYIANRGTSITFTLPATAALGTAISIIGKGAGGWSIAQGASQKVVIGSSASTVGAGGSIASTNAFDSIDLICTTANTIWTSQGAPQSAGLTIV